MNDDLLHLEKSELKRRVFGSFSTPSQPPSQVLPADIPASDPAPKPDTAWIDATASGGGAILICKKYGCLLPVCEGRADLLVQYAGAEERPPDRFYFTSEICFECSEQAAIFVPPVTLVRVPDHTQSPDKI